MLATLLTEFSMKAEDIEKYLSQLGHELLKRGIQEPIHLLLIGGAYMLLLTNTPRNTDDSLNTLFGTQQPRAKNKGAEQ
jgi:hypothetical protein